MRNMLHEKFDKLKIVVGSGNYGPTYENHGTLGEVAVQMRNGRPWNGS